MVLKLTLVTLVVNIFGHVISQELTTIPSTPEYNGLRCLGCHQSSSPSDCKQWVTCGENEECFTREFTTLTGTVYHTGCEHKSRCQLMQTLGALFGKRAAHTCFSCCGKDDCNAALCGGTGVSNPGERLRCKSCISVSDPRLCDKWALCETEEMCYTESKISTDGEVTFNLGCQYSLFCSALLPGITTPTGQTTLPPTPKDPRDCRVCCETEDCNSQHCLHSLNNTIVTTPMTSNSSDCPPSFIEEESFCFQVSQTTANWNSAKSACEHVGAQLLIIETPEKDDAVISLLSNMTNPSTSSKYWLGGFYTEATKSWMWLDLQPLTFNKMSGSSSSSRNYRLSMTMHGHNATLWTQSSYVSRYHYICEIINLP